MSISLYDICVRHGATIDNHASDLYILDDEAGRFAINEYQDQGGSIVPTAFRDSERRRWFEAPFAFDPWWEDQNRRAEWQDRAQREANMDAYEEACAIEAEAEALEGQ